MRTSTPCCKDNAPLYTALLDENCDGAFLEEIVRFAETFPTTFDRLDEATRRYLDLYSIHGLLAVVGRWLQNGTPEPTETIARLAIQMFSHGIMSFME